MSWKPNPQGISQILKLLFDSLKGENTIQKKVNEQLDYFNSKVPDFNNYLVYIFAKMQKQDVSIRRLAGLLLKKNIGSTLKEINSNAPQMLHIKQHLLEAICDENRYIRSTSGSCLTELVYRQGIPSWGSVIQQLVKFLDFPKSNNNQNPLSNITDKQKYAIEGSMSALYKICEDNTRGLINAKGDPLKFMIPKIIQFFNYPSESVRYNSLLCILPFINHMPNALLINMNIFLEGLFKLANDKMMKVRKYVCRAFTILIGKPQFIQNYIQKIFDYMILCTQIKDEAVAMEATEFWLAVGEQRKNIQSFIEILVPKLDTLLKALIEKMVYDEFDADSLEEESEMPDKDHDIAPQFSKHRKNRYSGQDDNDNDCWDEEEDWNIRKCSASSLDLFASIYQDRILKNVLEVIEKKMQPNQPWIIRESSILALGAIAEGCSNGIQKFLPNLIPYLLNHPLKDKKPLLRSITCWTLSRYSDWVAQQNNKIFIDFLNGLLVAIMDKNKKVQEAACSAFAIFEESANVSLIPHLEKIFNVFAKALKFYQKKNLIILYDTIGTLIERIKKHLDNPQCISIIVPPIIEKYKSADEKNITILSLTECITVIVSIFNNGFKNYSKDIYIKSYMFFKEIVDRTGTYKSDRDIGDFEKDFMVCLLELFVEFIEVYGKNVHTFFGNSQFFQTLLKCSQNNCREIKICAIGLIGDVARVVPSQFINGIVPQYIPSLLSNIDIKALSVLDTEENYHYARDIVQITSNCLWTIGEIIMKIQQNMKKYLMEIVKLVIPILKNSDLDFTLLENSSILFSRLAIFFSDDISKIIQMNKTIIENWIVALQDVRIQSEKEIGFMGLVTIIKLTPQTFVPYFEHLCYALCLYSSPNQKLQIAFRSILLGYKNGFGKGRWDQYFSKFNQKVQNGLIMLTSSNNNNNNINNHNFNNNKNFKNNNNNSNF